MSAPQRHARPTNNCSQRHRALAFKHLRELLNQILQTIVDVAASSGNNAMTLDYVEQIRHPSHQHANLLEGALRRLAAGAHLSSEA